MFKSYSISKRLRTAFFWVSLLVALSGVVGVIVIQRIEHDANIIFMKKYPIARDANNLSASVIAELVALHAYVLHEDDALRKWDEWHGKAVQNIASLSNVITETDDLQILNRIRTAHEHLERTFDTMRTLTNEDTELTQAMKLVGEGKTDVAAMLADINPIVAQSEAEMLQAMDEARAFQNKSTAALIIITLGAFIVAFWLGQHVSGGITRPLNALANYSKQISAGDLSKDVPLKDTEDEIGTLVTAFRMMIDGLRRQTREILDGTSVIASSVAELSASSAQLAASAAENASSINETTATVEEVRQTTELANAKAEQMADESHRIRETSRHGRKATDDTIGGMNKIQNQMSSIAETIIRLSEQSQAIGQIIATVDSISEQSNVLAVNASIEAARAGEHGKGFSVVAQEVKSLAEQSKQATTQVRSILNEIQKATSTAVMATDQGSKVVEKGTETAGQAGQSIIALTESLDQSADAATQIAAASQQQRIGMDQITAAMESVREASQQNASSAKQLEGAVHNLKTLGEKLKETAENYRI